MKHQNGQISMKYWLDGPLYQWPFWSWIFDVDRRSRPQIIIYRTALRVSLTASWPYLYFSRRWTSPTVQAHGSPRRHPFVFKDEGCVLVFCVPVLFLCLSVPYSVLFDEKIWEVRCVCLCVCVHTRVHVMYVSVCMHQHRRVFTFCVCACVECLCASVPHKCAVCIWRYMCICVQHMLRWHARHCGCIMLWVLVCVWGGGGIKGCGKPRVQCGPWGVGACVGMVRASPGNLVMWC